VLLVERANDWLHGNSLHWIPASGDLLFSMRHQDWVIKIDYKNGSGSGNVLWRLGDQGDFTMVSLDPYPWFSHQHDAEYEPGGLLTIFDNGNTRVARNPGTVENSRGQALLIDEVHFVARLRLNADLGVYAPAVSAAQRLDNGNYYFEAGIIGGSFGESIEVLPNGSLNYVFRGDTVTYRGYRMASLYQIHSAGN
jgi:hypothetical protein